jgi:pilus assembly protein CpaB
MRVKSLILIFIALGCGLVASIGISQVMQRETATPGIEMEPILVALTDIDIGTRLDAQNVRLEDWPKAKIPPGAIRRLEDVKDKFANVRFFKGEPLNVHKISDTLKNIAVQVPPGYRAMPVKVDEDTVMKAVSPGDRVDVMVFLRRNGQDIQETGTYTILKNVRVFAVNTNTERSTDGKGETTNFRTISLLVKPDHARELAVAAQMGKILLTLRRPDEQDDELGEDVTPISDILSGRSKQGSEPATAGNSSAGGFLGFVKSLAPTAPAPPPAAPIDQTAAPPAEPTAPRWVMEILGPTERKRYEWLDEKSLPVEAPLMPPASGAAPHGPAPSAASPVKPDAAPPLAPEPLQNPDASNNRLRSAPADAPVTGQSAPPGDTQPDHAKPD